MSQTTVTREPQNVQKELELLRWQNKQHMQLEAGIYCAMTFLGDTVGMGEDAALADLTLSEDARRGLSFIFASMRSLIGHACWNDDKPQFYTSLGYFRDEPDKNPE